MTYRICTCPDADLEHHDSQRQYAHVFHRGSKICVAHAFYFLPHTHQLGILLHEAGHILAGKLASEKSADRAAQEASGVTIRYKSSARYGDRLEWVRPKDKKKVLKFLGIEGDI